MKRLASVIAICLILSQARVLYAEESVKADKLVDAALSVVSYDIKTTEGEDIVVTAGYSSTRPNPEIENLDIAPRDSINDGTKICRIPTKEGANIEVNYTYSGGSRVGIKMSAEPSNVSSDEEYTQDLTVQSNGGYMISFAFIWQGKDLKEVRIEPLVNPFS